MVRVTVLMVGLAALGLAATAMAAQPQPELKALKGVRRVLILGDSITYGGGYVDCLDAYLFARYPDRRYELINAGLPSENLSGLTEPDHAGGAFPRPDLHERLARALEQTKPDLVVACYGMNDGIYYPLDETRLRVYQEGVRWLRGQVRAAHARLWLLTPPPFDPEPIRKDTLPAGLAAYPSGKPYVGYDDVLARYGAWLVGQRRAGWSVVDIHTPLNAYLRERRAAEPGFAFAGDGVHLNATGHRLIARELLRAWGAPAATLPPVDRPSGPEAAIAQRVHDRQRLLTDAWLTAIGHKRPGMPPGLPLHEAQSKAKALEDEIRAALAARAGRPSP